jgi:energy-coupling factor transport system substrate-specific component
MNTIVHRFANKLSIFEIVFIAVVSVALGVSFWGWNFIYVAAKPFLKIYGLSYLAAGFWILASVMLSSIVRKPGVAILASVIAAAVESVITQWGMMSVVWGVVQGVGAELIFFLFMYKKWDLKIMILASIFSAFCSYVLDYFYYGYGHSSIKIQIVQLSSFLISALIFSGLLSHYLVKRLRKIGLLNNFLIAKDPRV